MKKVLKIIVVTTMISVSLISCGKSDEKVEIDYEKNIKSVYGEEDSLNDLRVNKYKDFVKICDLADKLGRKKGLKHDEEFCNDRIRGGEDCYIVECMMASMKPKKKECYLDFIQNLLRFNDGRTFDAEQEFILGYVLKPDAKFTFSKEEEEFIKSIDSSLDIGKLILDVERAIKEEENSEHQGVEPLKRDYGKTKIVYEAKLMEYGDNKGNYEIYIHVQDY